MKPHLLTSLGINEKAANIYLASLGLGMTSIQAIAQKTGYKRPTVYLHVDELLKHGLIEMVPLNKKTYYQAVEPQILEAKMKKGLTELQAVLPELASKYANTLGKPQVRILSGENGVAEAYEEITRAHSFRVWSNVGTIHPVLNTSYERLAEAVKERGIGVREIIADNKESKRYAKTIARISGPTYAARVATVEGLANDTIIYGQVVAIFRLHQMNMFVVRIEDGTIADSMRAIFEMAWRVARPLSG